MSERSSRLSRERLFERGWGTADGARAPAVAGVNGAGVLRRDAQSSVRGDAGDAGEAVDGGAAGSSGTLGTGGAGGNTTAEQARPVGVVVARRTQREGAAPVPPQSRLLQRPQRQSRVRGATVTVELLELVQALQALSAQPSLVVFHARLDLLGRERRLSLIRRCVRALWFGDRASRLEPF